MHVLYVSDVYFPRVNGVSTSIRTFRADLADCGIESTLVVPDYGGGATDHAARPAEEPGVVRVRSSRVPRDPEDRFMHWSALESALAASAGRGVDLVHIQTPFLAHYAGTRAARRLGVPAVATYHTFFEDYLHHYAPLLPHAWGAALARRFTRSQCADVAALIAPSEPMRAKLHEYGVTTPIHVLPTGLPADRFRPGNGRAFRQWHGVPVDAPLLLYVGRVAHEKNIDFLLRMHVEVLRQRPDALLMIAGEGPARAALAAQAETLGIAARVRFVGYLERDTELLDCYAAGDVFVFASRTETQGLVLLEALAQGTPVVSTAELGTRSILVPDCGAVVAPEDERQFAARVVALLADASERARLAALARPYAERWSSASLARRLADLYRRYAARGQREGAAEGAAPRGVEV
jgi:glycosyltransferase involved in cell wall biosynthesis